MIKKMLELNELSQTFTSLFKSYSDFFQVDEYTACSRAELMKKIPTNKRGVYSYWVKDDVSPIYIGCAGKVSADGKLSGNTVRNRMFSASTPYHFSKETDYLLYNPTTAGVPPEDYKNKVSISSITIKIISINNQTAPAALEHLLLQGFINEYGALPLANQKI